ncbi:hypothetical protein LINPERHAP2_LOCUS38302 [Linum perenne]
MELENQLAHDEGVSPNANSDGAACASSAQTQGSKPTPQPGIFEGLTPLPASSPLADSTPPSSAFSRIKASAPKKDKRGSSKLKSAIVVNRSFSSGVSKKLTKALIFEAAKISMEAEKPSNSAEAKMVEIVPGVEVAHMSVDPNPMDPIPVTRQLEESTLAITTTIARHKPQLVAILEPRISGQVGSTVRSKMGFQFSSIVEARGFGGGIWLLWNDTSINVDVLHSSSQFLHMKIRNDSGGSCLATIVYAAPSLQSRRLLWWDIKQLAVSISEPWIILGDFNAMIEASKKSGGARFNHIQAREFRSCIHECSLFDTGFTGPKFTWFRGKLKEWLDRALCNAGWLNSFQDAKTFHLERIKSDHRPILVLTSQLGLTGRSSRPFRFNAAWLGHENFPSFLDHSWIRGRDFVSSLQVFKDRCVAWNDEVFGHIFKRKKRLEKRLRWLELHSHSRGVERYAKEEEEIRAELERTLWQEYMLWLQKSRI